MVLGAAASIATGLVAPARAQRVGGSARFLWIRNQAGEEVHGHYIKSDGWIDWRVVQRMQHLFRDLRESAPGPMPVLLLDVLWLIQAGWRHEKPLMLLSGYRTPRTNSTVASGEAATFSSRHLEGQAADIVLQDTPIAELAESAMAFSRIYNFMGVGIYPAFIHVDIGPKRDNERNVSRMQRQVTAPSPQAAPATQPAAPATVVRLVREGGTYKVPVKINGVLELHFTVDSGATDVVMPADVVLTLMRTGTITTDDFVGDQTYVLGDGRRIQSKTLRLRSLTVGGRTISNVLAAVGDVQSSLLLGQSFLGRFRRVAIDNSQGTLTLE